MLRLAVVASAIAASSLAINSVQASALAPYDPGCKTGIGPTGNVVFHDSCDGQSYVPDVAAADAQSQQIAFDIWRNVMQFCIAHPDGASLKAAGFQELPNDNHWSRDGVAPPSTTSEVIEYAKKPGTAPVGGNINGADSTIGIVVSTDWAKLNGIGYVGSIPPVHTHEHDLGAGGEMLHVWCEPTIEEAFEFDWPGDEERATTSELVAALQLADSGGIAAVSSQLGASGGAAVANQEPKPTQAQAPEPVQTKPRQTRTEQTQSEEPMPARTKPAKTKPASEVASTHDEDHERVSTTTSSDPKPILVAKGTDDTIEQPTELAVTGVDSEQLLAIGLAMMSLGLGCIYFATSPSVVRSARRSSLA